MVNNRLTVEISENAVRFSKHEGILTTFLETIVFKNASETLKKDQLVEFIARQNFSEFELYLNVFSEKNVLIPTQLFDGMNEYETKVEDLFKFTFNDDSDSIDYARLPFLSLVNIYEIPSWVKNFFVIRFPTIVIAHESTNILKLLSNFKGLNTRIALSVYKNHIQLSIFHLGAVTFQNTFEKTTAMDVVYYTLNALKQLALAGRRITFLISKGTDIEMTDCCEILEEFKNIKDFSNCDFQLFENLLGKHIDLCE